MARGLRRAQVLAAARAQMDDAALEYADAVNAVIGRDEKLAALGRAAVGFARASRDAARKDDA